MNETSIHERQGTLMGDAIADAAIEPSKSQLQTSDQHEDSGEMFIRLARDPNISVEKIERLMALWERQEDRRAEAAFNTAFALMQAEIPVIVEKGKGDGGKWMFAPLEDIVEPLRPILTKHGFSLSHQTEWPDTKTVKVIGILTHRGGHARRSEFQASADQTGSKNAIQALGSTVAYGKRYTAKDLLLIVTRGEDDDARRAGLAEAPDPPEGFDKFWKSVSDAAKKGLPAFDPAWECGDAVWKNYAVKYMRNDVNELKKTAREAGRK